MRSILTSSVVIAACLLASSAHAQGTRKTLEDTASGRQSSDSTFDGRRSTPPVEAPRSTTRTPEQAIKEYKDSGKPTGPQTIRTTPPPPPPPPAKKK